MREQSESEISVPRKVKISGDWLWRGVFFIMLSASLWLKTQYVSKDDFKERITAQAVLDTKRDEQIKLLSDALIEIKAQSKDFDVINSRLADHETRLRVIERLQK